MNVPGMEYILHTVSLMFVPAMMQIYIAMYILPNKLCVDTHVYVPLVLLLLAF